MLGIAAESPASGARFVGLPFLQNKTLLLVMTLATYKILPARKQLTRLVSVYLTLFVERCFAKDLIMVMMRRINNNNDRTEEKTPKTWA